MLVGWSVVWGRGGGGEGTDTAVAFGLIFATGEDWGGCAEG